MNLSSLRFPSRFTRAFASGLALAALLLVANTGCHQKTTYSTHAAGHSITARIEGSTRSIETLPTQAVVRGARGSVRIERDRVRIDDGPWTGIPDDVAVDITIDQHTVRVKVGRVTVERTVNS